MKRNFLAVHWNAILSGVLRLLLAFFATAVLAGMEFPFISGEKARFIGLIVVGVAVSAAGNWNMVSMFRLSDPINIIGSILGIAALLLIIFTLAGINVPLITGHKMAFLVLAVFLLLKVGLKILQNAIRKVEA